MSAPLILVVDDHPPNLALLMHLLTLHGYEVTTAGNADEALAAMGRQLPRLILMDLQMPGVDGFELTRRLKADPATAAIPIVAVTSYAMSGDRERALAAGCDDHVAKPIDTRALPPLVARHLARTAGLAGTPPAGLF
jgi:CheY-like chemotaxis protein